MTKGAILVMNVGSSSLKFKVFYKNDVIMKGYAERLKTKKDYKRAINRLINEIRQKNINIVAIGHRIVHGGSIRHSSIITTKLTAYLRDMTKFAPLHNVPAMNAIQACKRFKVKQIAVFDTAFHRSIPEKARIYAAPYKLYKEGIMRYGFHGISCAYILRQARKMLKRTPKRMLICHLGNGSSITALRNGRSIDTSMGFTPLEGIVMATRSGNIDPGIVEYLSRIKHNTAKKTFNILNKQSGLLGISGISHDIRDLQKAAKKGNKRAKLAMDIFIYSIVKQIDAYAAALNGLDALIFTGGIGENSGYVRRNVLKSLKHLKKFKVLAIKTDEELMIKNEVERLLK